MNQPDLTGIIGFFPFGFIKLMVLIILLMYVVFAAVIVRQETLMARVVELSFSPLLRFIVILHFVLAIAIFVLTLSFL